MSKKRIKDDTLISGTKPVTEWEKLREKLIVGILKKRPDELDWKSAFELFETRINTRFLNPINWILEKGDNRGEGFSIVALQCILIEFFEAFYQGKIYTTSKELKSFEYYSSRDLFCDFLLNHKPFSDYFKDKKNAEGFYDNIRCGLLHEAATKETSKIKRTPENDKLILASFEKDDPRNMQFYRENFHAAIKEYIKAYKEELFSDFNRKINFIRKWDDISGIKHNYYFAYGSNMFPERLLERIKKYHTAFPAVLKDYRFVYNKKGQNGTAKANIESAKGSDVYGVCYEIDEDDLSILQKYEKGYNRENNIIIHVKDGEEKVVTFISESIDNKLSPSDDYKKLVLKGASSWKIDNRYIDKYLA